MENPELVKCILHPNVGVAECRNIGILAASGEYILFSDHDDEFPDGALLRIAELVEKHKPDILNFRAEMIDDKDKHLSYGPNVFIGNQSAKDVYCSMRKTWGVLWDGCYRRALIQRKEILPSKYFLCEDFWLRTQVYWSANDCFGVDEVLYRWRVLPGSTSHNSKARKKYMESQMYYLNRLMSFVKSLSTLRYKDKKFWTRAFCALIRGSNQFYSTLSIEEREKWKKRTISFKRNYLKLFGIMPTTEWAIVTGGAFLPSLFSKLQSFYIRLRF